MSCFCVANLNLLPNLNTDASLNLSVSAQAALALYTQISLGIPDLPVPAIALPSLDLFPPDIDFSVDALASVTAMAQLRAQAMASLGIDLATDVGITAIARVTATLDARLSMIASLNLNLDTWIQLAQVNAVSLELTAIFNACLTASASTAFNVVLAPPSWGGLHLPLFSALVSLSARLNVSLDAEFIASMQAMATAVASATANIALDVSATASLSAGFCAIAQLSASLGIKSLEIGLPAVQAMVAANFSAMASLAAQLGIDLKLGIPGLPSLPSIPGFSAALTASLAAQLQAAIDASASFNASLMLATSFDTSLSMSAMLAASLSVCLSAVLDIDVTLPAPCASCDLRPIMRAVDAAVPILSNSAVIPASGGGPSLAPNTPGNALASDTRATTNAASDASGGGSSGSGGGVQATVMTAQMMCTMGLAPSALNVLPIHGVTASKQIAANIMDHVPMVNIMPFGMCISPANPMVAAATAAAFGVLTPMPCIPATSSPWTPGAPTVTLGKQPMLDSTSKCICNWTGVISIAFSGQLQTSIP